MNAPYQGQTNQCRDPENGIIKNNTVWIEAAAFLNHPPNPHILTVRISVTSVLDSYIFSNHLWINLTDLFITFCLETLCRLKFCKSDQMEAVSYYNQVN